MTKPVAILVLVFCGLAVGELLSSDASSFSSQRTGCPLDDRFDDLERFCNLTGIWKHGEITLVGEGSQCILVQSPAISTYTCSNHGWKTHSGTDGSVLLHSRRRRTVCLLSSVLGLATLGLSCLFTRCDCERKPPVIQNCPKNQVIKDVRSFPTLCSWLHPTALLGNLLGKTDCRQVKGPPSGSLFKLGTTLIEYLARDTTGQTSTCSFTVSVLDSQPPKCHNCPSNIIKNGQGGSGVVVHWLEPSCSDDSNTCTFHKSHTPGFHFPPGVTPVRYEAVDPSGNKASCEFTVTVQNPVCPDPKLQFDAGHTGLLEHDCKPNPTVGDTCHITCNINSAFRGAAEITCEMVNANPLQPEMRWTWAGGQAAQPTCIASNCTQLRPPAQGAFSCLTGNHGLDCYLSCQQGWYPESDVPDYGRYTCVSNPLGISRWIPTTVPQCLRVCDPTAVGLTGKYFFFTNTCQFAADQIRQSFMDRLTNSIFRSACSYDYCVASNVQVKCGSTFARSARQALDLLVTIDFHVDLKLAHPADAKSNFQRCTQLKDNLRTSLSQAAQKKELNFPGVIVDQPSVGALKFDLTCPNGTVYKARDGDDVFSCSGCSSGKFLPDGSSRCEICPVGTYNGQENSASCTRCPAGTTTLYNESKSSQDCRAICQPGFYSADGLEPCMPCLLGTYQSLVGATSCLSCPVGTWTLEGKSTSLQQCVPSDIYLTNTNLVLERPSGWTSMSVATWIFMEPGSSLKLAMDGLPSRTLEIQLTGNSSSRNLIFRNGFQYQILPWNSNPWFHVLIGASNLALYLNKQNLLAAIETPATPSRASLSVNDKLVVFSDLQLLAGDPEESVQTIGNLGCHAENSGPHEFVKGPSLTLRSPSLCSAVDGCASHPCGDHPCENVLADVACHCAEGWMGLRCEVAPKHCANNPCLHGATCLPYQGKDVCFCAPGYTGQLCESAIECPKLEKAEGTVLTCQTTDHSTRCSFSCAAGYVSDVELLPWTECGPDTHYLWTHQFGDSTARPTLPGCSRIYTSEGAALTHTVYLNFPSDAANVIRAEDVIGIVRDRLRQNVSSWLPCEHEGACKTDINVACGDASTLSHGCARIKITIQLNAHFGASVFLDQTNPSLVKYTHNLQLVDQSATMLLNSTRTLFTLTIGNITLLPDLSSISSTAVLVCPPGAVSTEGVCFNCSAGSMENKGICELCPLGTYQDQPSSSSCKPCPDHLTTNSYGASSVYQCIPQSGRPTEVPPVSIRPLQCRKCVDPFCTLSIESIQHCPSETPFCATEVQSTRGGSVSLSKRCASKVDCDSLWLEQTWKQAACLNFSPNEVADDNLHCFYCCITDNCNVHARPDTPTLYPAV